jgi:hypothetical protein
MDPIIATLDSIEIGTPVTAANLSMFPLLLREDVAPPYQTLDEALAAGLASVTEVTESGSVPELLVKNDGALPLLILDGEELVGAKQNRIVNLTILVPARQTLHIPVSCVEAGRWARRSREFAAAGRVHYASGRAQKLHHVSDSLHDAGRRDADQSEVWRDIDAKAARMQASSTTHAAAAMYEKAQRQLAEFQERLVAVPRQAGALFTINGVVAGLDLFDSQVTWRRSMRKLVQSYGLDALDQADGPVSDAGPQPERFLAAVKGATCERFRALGLGEDVRISGDRIAGAALTQDSTVIHLVAFPAA